MFVGRESELKALTEFMNAAETKAATVYGRRRIGKTTLLRKAIVDAPGKTIFFEALDGRYETNLNLLAKQVSDLLGAPLGSFQHHLDLFHTLQLYKEPLTIVIDEYQFLKQSRTGNEVDSEFKQIIDQLPGNMKLILTGSHVTMMKELLEQDNPLFGRFQLVMRVDELEYWQAQAFYPDLPVYDKACFHSVFGACPYILENLNPALGLMDNIINMFVRQNGLARIYIEYILFKEIGKVSILNDILRVIGNGKVRYSQIENSLNLPSNGLLSKYLGMLQDMGLIASITPINKKNDRKKAYYAIADNLVRFYYTYIYPNASSIIHLREEDFYDAYIKLSIGTFISIRFESIVRDYLRIKVAELEGTTPLDIGTFWYDDPKTKKNGEFDCAVRFNDHYSLYEAKFYTRSMSVAEMRAEAAQVSKVQGLGEIRLGFASVNGFEEAVDDYILIDGEDLYSL